MSMYDGQKYMTLQCFKKKWFFLEDPNSVNPSDLLNIKPLTEDYSGLLWEEYISKTNKHIMQLKKADCPFLPERQKYNWTIDWNNRNHKSFIEQITKLVDLDNNDIILFFWMKERSVETTWGLFLKYWIEFLYEDEGPIIISQTKVDSIIFCSSGAVLSGKRPVL